MTYEINQFERDPAKLYIDQPTFFSMALELYHKVDSYQEESGMKVDTLVGAPRGALELMSVMSQLLLLHGQQVQCVNLNTRTDAGVQSDVKYGQMPETVKIQDKNCLWVDDVRDTGVTEDASERILLELGARRVVRADLGYKPDNDIATPEKRPPDLYIFQTKKWVVFHWERLAEYRAERDELKRVVPAEELSSALAQLKSNFMRAQGFASVPIIGRGTSEIVAL